MIAHLPVFVVTTFVMLVVPGPDFVVITRNAVVRDRRQAYLTAAGICGGLLFLTLATASGLAALVAANGAMLFALRIVGGAYLIFLAVMLVVSARRRYSSRQPESRSPWGARSPVLQGFLNNVLNPKALIFYLTFMPQFLEPDESVFLQTLFMGVVVVSCAATWWTLYIMAIGALKTALTRISVQSGIDLGAGIALGGLGAVILLGGL